MTRIRNAKDFRNSFNNTRKQYEESLRPRFIKNREQMGTISPTLHPSVDQVYESQIRASVIDALLSALNWDVLPVAPGALPNLIPEEPVESIDRDRRRYLDYLGLEASDACRPLMIVEAKRPWFELPAVESLPEHTRLQNGR